MTAVIPVPGVLKDDRGAPVQAMLMVALAVMGSMRTVLVSDDERDELFCKREGLKGYAQFRLGKTLDALAEERVGTHVDVVFTADTEEAREISKQGLTVVLVAASTAVNPKYRPSRKDWGAIVEEFE